jgi:Chitin binding Peritrophin-A domain
MFRVLNFLIVAFISGSIYAQETAEFDEEICIGLDDDVIIPIEGSCDDYYFCSGQVGYLYKCSDYGEEYQFDVYLNDCNLASEANCVETPQIIPTNSPQTTAAATTITTTITTTEAITETTSNKVSTEIGDIECPTNRPGEILFYESLNCTEYYICANGLRMTMKCMEGFVWNPQENQCDFPAFNPRCSVIMQITFDLFM